VDIPYYDALLAHSDGFFLALWIKEGFLSLAEMGSDCLLSHFFCLSSKIAERARVCQRRVRRGQKRVSVRYMLLNHSRFLLKTKNKYADLFSCVVLMSDVHRPELRNLLGGRINSIMIK